MKNGVLAVIFFLFLFYFYIHSALALGMTPARITMDFVPNYEGEFEGAVINSQGGTIPVDIYFDKELAQYMTLLTPNYIEVGPGQSVPFKFKLELPSDFEEPGYHWGIIWAQQHVEGPAEGGAVVRVRVGSQVLVKVPYPGKYARIELNIENANVNDTVIFEIEATNFGKENITNARGEIRIMDLENKTVVVLQTEGGPIQTTEVETFRATWFSDVDPGLYQVEAVLYYDDQTPKKLRETFNLGAPLIKITNISAEPIVNGTIGKVLAEIHSFWNLNIEDVYIEFSVRTLEDKEIYNDKSQSIIVGPFKTYVVTVYWDTAGGFELGDYKGVLILHYLNRNETAEIDLELIAKPGITIGIEILILIVVVIAAIAVVLFFFFYRKRKGKYKQKKLT